MKHLYSIMPLDTIHLEEICLDIKEQYEKGIAACALFMFKLVPEGNPLINKAKLQGEKYRLFRDRLKEMGLECGILVQCTIGHGYPLNEPNRLTRYVNLHDGAQQYVTCPYDVDFQSYIKEQMKIVASLSPKVIMVDDDFRLMYREGKGCACHLHMAAYHEKSGTNISREELYERLQQDGDTLEKRIYVETQRESLLQGAKAMREGIDAVDEALPGIFCCVGPTTEFGADIAKILAGKGNPAVVRINNGNYTPAGARWFSDIVFRASDEINRLKRDGVDIVLAETDTCPQNRYSTGTASLHAHFVGSILEGVNGAKHWITRLSTHEPNSGKAYRKTLSAYSGFYNTLSKLVPTLEWQGCRIPLTTDIQWNFEQSGWVWKKNAWLRNVLERFGFPAYCSSALGGAVFLNGDLDGDFSDEEILAFLKGTVVLDVFALMSLNQRGFSQYTGVVAKEWHGVRLSHEKFTGGCICGAQVASRELVPLCERVQVSSWVCHLAGDNEEHKLFPGVTIYKNELGGTVIATCGTPNTNYNYVEAFSFLNESRKKQFAEILMQTGDLPIYYNDDAEVYMKTAKTPDGKRFCAIFNIGMDILEDVSLTVKENVRSVQMLKKDGTFDDCTFVKQGNTVTIQTPVYTLMPLILLMDLE